MGTAPLTDAEQLLLALAGRGLQTLQEPSGDMEDVIGVREESFQVELRQLKGTEMPQAKPNISEMVPQVSGVLEALLETFCVPQGTSQELEGCSVSGGFGNAETCLGSQIGQG